MIRVPVRQGQEYYRAFLTNQGKAVYDSLYSQLCLGNCSGETAFPITDSSAMITDCSAAYKAFKDDHPEFFFLGAPKKVTYYGTEGTLSYLILYPPDIIRRIEMQLRRSVYRIVRGTAALQTIEQEELVYKRIAQMLVFFDHNDVRDHNVVGPVLTSSGVCEGYNALLLLCYRRIGIPCIKVYGNENTHCWTIAWINGVPVHCDVTWDGTEDRIVRFNYFNLSDAQIAEDHHNFAKPNIPRCSSAALSYYRYHGLCVDSHTSLRSHLKKEKAEGKTSILIHFDYQPDFGDYIREVQTALRAEGLYGEHKLYHYPSLQNIALIAA